MNESIVTLQSIREDLLFVESDKDVQHVDAKVDHLAEDALQWSELLITDMDLALNSLKKITEN